MSKWNVEIIMNNGVTIGPCGFEGDSPEDILPKLISTGQNSFNSVGFEENGVLSQQTFYRGRGVSVVKFELEEN